MVRSRAARGGVLCASVAWPHAQTDCAWYARRDSSLASCCLRHCHGAADHHRSRRYFALRAGFRHATHGGNDQDQQGTHHLHLRGRLSSSACPQACLRASVTALVAGGRLTQGAVSLRSARRRVGGHGCADRSGCRLAGVSGGPAASGRSSAPCRGSGSPPGAPSKFGRASDVLLLTPGPGARSAHPAAGARGRHAPPRCTGAEGARARSHLSQRHAIQRLTSPNAAHSECAYAVAIHSITMRL